MAERLRTEGVGKGVYWPGLSNVANIIQRGGESTADIISRTFDSIQRSRAAAAERESQQKQFERQFAQNQAAAQAAQADRQRTYELGKLEFEAESKRKADELESNQQKNRAASLVSAYAAFGESGDVEGQQAARDALSTLLLNKQLSPWQPLSGESLGDLDTIEPGPFSPSPEFVAERQALQAQASAYSADKRFAQPAVFDSAVRAWADRYSDEEKSLTERINMMRTSGTRMTPQRRDELSRLQAELRRARGHASAARVGAMELGRVVSAAQSEFEASQIDEALKNPYYSDDFKAGLQLNKEAVRSGRISFADAQRQAAVMAREGRMTRVAENQAVEAERRAMKNNPEGVIRELQDKARAEFIKMGEDLGYEGGVPILSSAEEEKNMTNLIAGRVPERMLKIVASDQEAPDWMRRIALVALRNKNAQVEPDFMVRLLRAVGPGKGILPQEIDEYIRRNTAGAELSGPTRPELVDDADFQAVVNAARGNR